MLYFRVWTFFSKLLQLNERRLQAFAQHQMWVHLMVANFKKQKRFPHSCATLCFTLNAEISEDLPEFTKTNRKNKLLLIVKYPGATLHDVLKCLKPHSMSAYWGYTHKSRKLQRNFEVNVFKSMYIYFISHMLQTFTRDTSSPHVGCMNMTQYPRTK